MNLVTGLWGMNVHVPGQDIETGVSNVLMCGSEPWLTARVVRLVWRDSRLPSPIRSLGSICDGE